jgi:hypothetical protein
MINLLFDRLLFLALGVLLSMEPQKSVFDVCLAFIFTLSIAEYTEGLQL